ncbi:glycoside hydrolase family 108 protein [Xanthobacter sp. V3C-3]|uniref:glycoside hydrolase family 108 protein n=1 Tax=Xanthobacter lutulentifluminis TaxID=3119935 RepID=UPI003729EE0C
MAAESFRRALAKVLVHEGGYSNHPDDPGGPTMQGIIQRVYDGYRRGKGLPTRSVRELERRELEDIYRKNYWDAARCDELPAGIDYVVFDGAVNSGPVQSAKWLQRALGLPADGAIGAVTLAAARAAPNRVRLVDDICDRRIAMLKALSTWPVFGRGWGRRVADVRRDGKDWVRHDAPPAETPVPVGGVGEQESAKAPPSSAAPAPSADKGAGAIAGGIVASTVSEAARQVQPYADGSPILGKVFAALTIAGLICTVGGLLYVWWSARASRRRADALDLVPVVPAPTDRG